MGIDYYTCANCTYNFPDCGEYYWCDCGEHYCSQKCGNGKIVDEQDIDDNWTEHRSCMICRGEHVTDAALMEWVLKRANLTRKQAEDLYLGEQKSK